jgi:3-hydroxyacyl-[acyl-carrier-protein] dehydratase
VRLEYFQMLDGIGELDLDRAALVAHSSVPEVSPVFEGHFAGHPLMPGVLLLETMAQASGYLLLALSNFDRMVFLVGAKEAKFRSFVVPGDQLSVHAARQHDGSGYAVMRCRIDRDGSTVSDAVLTMRLVPFANEALRLHVRREGARLGLFAGTGGT